MNTYPGFYADIGKKARDLLYKDYAQQATTHFSYRSFNWNLDLSCETPEIFPGFTTLFRFLIPDSCKVELRYLNKYLGVSSGIGLKSFHQGTFRGNAFDPVVHFSGLIGTESYLSLGAALAFDVSRTTFDKLRTGFSINFPILETALILDDKLKSIRASCYHEFNPVSKTAMAVELKHEFFDTGATTFTVGAQHAIFPFALVNARVEAGTRIGGVVGLELWEKLFFAMAGEVDLRAMKSAPNVGFSVGLKL